jgi:hypothetical protein
MLQDLSAIALVVKVFDKVYGGSFVNRDGDLVIYRLWKSDQS